jgi:hypothetical protein
MMSVLKVIGIIALVAAGIRWAVLVQQEIDRQQSIVQEASQVLQSGKALPSNASIQLRGKALVWDMSAGACSGAYGQLPRELRASSSDRPITVFMVTGTREEQVGTYSISRQPAYRRYVEIAVAYWPERKAAGKASVVSEEPRSVRPVEHEPEYGDPSEPIANYIQSLPRAN